MINEEFDFISYAMGEKNGGGGSSVTVEPITITENGAKTAPAGKAYSPVTVAVPTEIVAKYNISGLTKFSDITFGSPVKKVTVVSEYESDDPSFTLALSNIHNVEEAEIRTARNPSDFKQLCQNSGFRRVTINASFENCPIANNSFRGCANLETIDGTPFDFTSVTTIGGCFSSCPKLTNISFVPSCIKYSIGFASSPLLSTASLVSIANAIDSTVTGQTLTLHADCKTACQTLMGTVADGLFTADASGTVTLVDYISQTKGWTLA